MVVSYVGWGRVIAESNAALLKKRCGINIFNVFQYILETCFFQTALRHLHFVVV